MNRAFTTVVERHYSAMRSRQGLFRRVRHARRVVADAWLTALAASDGFDGSKPDGVSGRRDATRRDRVLRGARRRLRRLACPVAQFARTVSAFGDVPAAERSDDALAVLVDAFRRRYGSR